MRRNNHEENLATLKGIKANAKGRIAGYENKPDSEKGVLGALGNLLFKFTSSYADALEKEVRIEDNQEQELMTEEQNEANTWDLSISLEQIE